MSFLSSLFQAWKVWSHTRRRRRTRPGRVSKLRAGGQRNRKWGHQPGPTGRASVKPSHRIGWTFQSRWSQWSRKIPSCAAGVGTEAADVSGDFYDGFCVQCMFGSSPFNDYLRWFIHGCLKASRGTLHFDQWLQPGKSMLFPDLPAAATSNDLELHLRMWKAPSKNTKRVWKLMIIRLYNIYQSISVDLALPPSRAQLLQLQTNLLILHLHVWW